MKSRRTSDAFQNWNWRSFNRHIMAIPLMVTWIRSQLKMCPLTRRYEVPNGVTKWSRICRRSSTKEKRDLSSSPVPNLELERHNSTTYYAREQRFRFREKRFRASTKFKAPFPQKPDYRPGGAIWLKGELVAADDNTISVTLCVEVWKKSTFWQLYIRISFRINSLG